MHHHARIPSSNANANATGSHSAGHGYPAWIDANGCGVSHHAAMPRVRDSLILRLVAGRRQDRDRPLVHAIDTP
jgi:hypothetical protein